MTLMAPADAAEMDAALALSLSLPGPAALRYPRDQAPEPLPGPCPPFELGRSRTVREGDDGVFFCYGATVAAALAAAERLSERGLSIGVINARFAKPLDAAAIGELLRRQVPVVTVEDHVQAGGFGAAVGELAVSHGWSTRSLRVAALPDEFIPHASRGEQLAWVGLDADGLARTMREHVETVAQRVGAGQRR
jgi:1-deoxy-D-xylulose-5-phosphate synthase